MESSANDLNLAELLRKQRIQQQFDDLYYAHPMRIQRVIAQISVVAALLVSAIFTIVSLGLA